MDTEKEIKEINNRLNDIDVKLEKILSSLQIIESSFSDVESATKNMDDHINFVNGVYDQVKRPFTTLMSTVNKYSGGEEILYLEDNSEK